MPRRRHRSKVYRFRLHARVTDPIRPTEHGTIVRRGFSNGFPAYLVRWDANRVSTEHDGSIVGARGGAAHQNRSAAGKRAWRARNMARESPLRIRQAELVPQGPAGAHAPIVDPLAVHAFNVQAKKRLGKLRAPTNPTIDMFGGTVHAQGSPAPTQVDMFARNRSGAGHADPHRAYEEEFERARKRLEEANERATRTGSHDDNRKAWKASEAYSNFPTFSQWQEKHEKAARRRGANRSLGVVGTASLGKRGTVRLGGRLEVIGYKKGKRPKIVEAEAMPGDEFFGIPETISGRAFVEKKASGYPVRRARLTKSAYLDAREARSNIPPDQLAAFDAVWRTLWPPGRASLTERFMEWAESHPNELADYQIAYAEKRQREYERQERRAMQQERRAMAANESRRRRLR